MPNVDMGMPDLPTEISTEQTGDLYSPSLFMSNLQRSETTRAIHLELAATPPQGLDNVTNSSSTTTNQNLPNTTVLGLHCLADNDYDLSLRLCTEYKRTKDMDTLQQAISHATKALAAAPQDDPLQAHLLDIVATQLGLRYQRTRAMDDLQQAILYSKEALEKTPHNYPDRAGYLNNLAAELVFRHNRTGTMDDLEQAISYTKEAIAAMPHDHPGRVSCLNNLATQLNIRYNRAGAMDDLQQAILHTKEALAAIPSDHPSRAGYLGDLASRFGLGYMRTEAINDLQDSIFYGQEALGAIPMDNPDRVSYLNNLAVGLGSRYRRTGAMEDLDKAVLYLQEALAANSHPDRVSFLCNLGIQLSLRYRRTGAIGNLEQAILYTQEALAATPHDHPNRGGRLSNLASGLSLRYERTGAINDLEQAISYGQDALDVTPKDDPDRIARLYNQSAHLSLRYRRIGVLDDLQQAITYGEDILAVTAQENPTRASYLNHQCDRLSLRYKRTGAMDDLQQAISYGEEALAATPQDRYGRFIYLDNLAVQLCSRYIRTGTMDDLQQAISYGEEALAAIPQEHPDRAGYLNNLSIRLDLRYRRTEAIEDLQQAILYAKEALAPTLLDHPSRAGYLIDLANRLSLRYKFIGNVGDLQQAISYSKEAVGSTPQAHPDRPRYLQCLASHLLSKYEKTDMKESDLHQAILYDQEALAEIPLEHPDRARALTQLAYKLGLRSQQTIDIQDALNDEEPSLAISQEYFNQAGNPIAMSSIQDEIRRASHYASTEDLGNCILHLNTAWGCSMSPPLVRIVAARFLASITQTFEESKISRELGLSPKTPHPIGLKRTSLRLENALQVPERLSSLLQDAVLLLPKVSPRSLERQDQQYNLKKLNGIAEDAASFALGAGKTAYDALKLLELSRGIIMGFAIDCRSDLSDLEKTHPKLSQKFDSLRTEIDSPLPDRNYDRVDTLLPGSIGKVEHNQDRAHALRRREQAIRKMEEIIVEIRNISGHERFQLPPSQNDLMCIAKDGPIVVFISTIIRSDAIIVTSSTIRSIPLPKLDYHEIPDRLGKIAELTKPTKSLRKYISNNKQMLGLLSWLWDVAVGPVIQELRLVAKPGAKETDPAHLTAKAEAEDTDLAHIWWIGVGRLCMAPFHAAGHYSLHSDPFQNALSYAISSYTPTIKALTYAREKDLSITSDGEVKILLVTMPTTPGQKDLPDVDDEVKRIAETWKKSTLMEHPSAKDILEQFESCHVIHFACHGISDIKDPSDSHLVLVKDGQADKLTIQDISRKNMKTARLAYLSACSTADNPEMKLADETIHIASGFQLAGFSHVLATMWAADSKTCTDVSTEFYRSLFKDGGEGHRKVAMAFHKAVKKAQANNPREPIKWAPFIHMGA